LFKVREIVTIGSGVTLFLVRGREKCLEERGGDLRIKSR